MNEKILRKYKFWSVEDKSAMTFLKQPSKIGAILALMAFQRKIFLINAQERSFQLSIPNRS